MDERLGAVRMTNNSEGTFLLSTNKGAFAPLFVFYLCGNLCVLYLVEN